MGRLFGTDGARGVAITELTCETAMNIGRAAATVLTRHKTSEGRAKILIGKDTRISSDVLEAALIAGITSVGVDAELLGVVPTPTVAYLVKLHQADAGVMISASHNPVEDNGIKLFADTGYKLPDEIENEIEELILDCPEKIQLKNGCEIGRVSTIRNAVEEYNSHLASTAECSFSGIKVAIDCANGSASATAETLFSKLGANCTMLYNSPDGCNINDSCGSTHIESLRTFVKEHRCDLGIAFDGDADRCIAVDENGNIVDGDKLIAIISDHMRSKGTLKKDTAVVTVMSNLGFHTYMKNNHINTVCTAVGDRYVLEEMLKCGYNIGGEQSGHIIFLDHATTGDGQLTAVQLLNLLAATKKPLSELVSGIPDFPQLLMNVKITEDKKGKWDKTPSILSAIKEAEDALGENGRVLVRESGTEPLVRVMIEGKNADEVKYWTEKIVEKVEEELCGQ
ncbi:MAG: phosphoglucosamine mutase [Oscillospiraceae bacterium]|nr:phosphoglucosamine mutase [Oscillospiraceae bacterium]